MSSSDSSTPDSPKSSAKTAPIVPGTYLCECGCGRLSEAAIREMDARNAKLSVQNAETTHALWADHKPKL